MVESTTSYTFPVQTGGIFYFPCIDTRYKGSTSVSVSPERHWQSGVNRIAKVPKRSSVALQTSFFVHGPLLDFFTFPKGGGPGPLGPPPESATGFCFAVVMPQPVTTLAGSDAYLGHQKQDVGEFNPSRPGARYAVCALSQGIQECEEEAARVGRDRGVPAYDSWRLFCRLCRRLNTNKSNKRSCISRRLLYDAIIDDALR